MGRDSNPRYLSVHTLSRRAQSTALAPILQKVGLWIRMGERANEIAERQPSNAPDHSFFLVWFTDSESWPRTASISDLISFSRSFSISSFSFFFSSRRRHTISLCDWSSDVCSSD